MPESGPEGLFETDLSDTLMKSVLSRGMEAIEAGRNPEEVLSAFTTAIKESIPEVATIIVRNFDQQARSVLRQSRVERTGFEQRLCKRWGKAFDLYEVILDLAMELGDDYWVHNSRQISETPEAVKLYALTRLHARACRTGAEVLTLLGGGFGVAAFTRWRTLHELAIVSALLAKHSLELSERFLDHAMVEQASDAEEYQGQAVRLGYSPLTADEMDLLWDARAAMVRKYGHEFGRVNGWAAILTKSGKAPTIRDLEVLAGLKHLRPYYRLSSHGVHAGARASELNVLRRGKQSLLMARASNAGLADPAQASLIALLQVTTNLLFFGREGQIGYNEAIYVTALHKMVERASEMFANVEIELAEAEQKLWHVDDSAR